MSPKFFRFTAGWVGILGTMVVSGCIDDRLPPVSPGGFVEETLSLSHTLHFRADSAQLNRSELERLSSFLDDADPMRKAVVRIAMATGETERWAATTSALAGLGWTSVEKSDLEPPAHIVQLSIDRTVLLPERCIGSDLWQESFDASGWTLPIGCSNSLNLEAMIEEPSDLVHGRALGPAPAKPAVDVARRYLSRHAWTPPLSSNVGLSASPQMVAPDPVSDAPGEDGKADETQPLTADGE